MAATSAFWSQGGKHLRAFFGTWCFLVHLHCLDRFVATPRITGVKLCKSELASQPGRNPKRHHSNFSVIHLQVCVFQNHSNIHDSLDKGYDLGLWTRVGCRLTLNLEKMLGFFETDFVLVLSQNCLKRASIDDQNGNSILTLLWISWTEAMQRFFFVFRCSLKKRKVSILEFWWAIPGCVTLGGPQPPFLRVQLCCDFLRMKVKANPRASRTIRDRTQLPKNITS